MTDLRQSPSGQILGVASPLAAWSLQPAWAVDPTNGNDLATGTPAAPLKTAAELGARLSGQRLQQNTTVTLLGSLPSNDPLFIAGTWLGSFTFELSGTLENTVAGQLVTVTANATTGRAPWLLETSGIDWTTATQRRIELSGGSVGWVGEVIDATHVRVSTFQGENSDNDVTPVALDTFVASVPSSSPTISLGIEGALDDPVLFTAPAQAQVRVRNLTLSGAGRSTSSWRSAQLWGCRIQNPRTLGISTTVLRSCFRDTAQAQEFIVRDDAYLLIVDGVMVQDSSGVGQLWVPAGLTAWVRGLPWFRNTGIFLQSSVFLHSFSRMHFEQFNIGIDSTAAMLSLTGIVSGTSTLPGSFGLVIRNAQVALYSVAAKPTISGAGGDTVIGGTVTAYAGVPFINAANLARLVTQP